MRSVVHISLAAFMASIVIPSDSVAQASPELQKAAILATVAEAALSNVSLIRNRADADVGRFYWSARYSESDWKFEANGFVRDKEIKLIMNGYLWNIKDGDFSINYSGTGVLGEETITMHGKSEWYYDEELKDYRNSDFHHVTKFGENSVWSWIVGAEIVFGGTMGALAGAGATTLATAGAAIGAAPIAAANGALIGAGGMITLSKTIRESGESSEPIKPPLLPVRPSLPNNGDRILQNEGYIVVAMSFGGEIIGSGEDGRYVLLAKYSPDQGRAEGSVFLQ
jgi:hypothetical protein